MEADMDDSDNDFGDFKCPSINPKYFVKGEIKHEIDIKDNIIDRQESFLRKKDYVEQQMEKDFENNLEPYTANKFIDDLIEILEFKSVEGLNKGESVKDNLT